MKMTPANARKFIQMEYSEFPDAVLHAELCAALERMATSQFPETQITRIRARIGRMESTLVQKFGVKRS